ncbi:GrpB family protein [Sporosarcina sp.]|uniref:GrpB family protein n=1 Tax=Sporosarcina sp. TaxID=49982 RepID=UPI00261C1567|nr:GrpB family protein [Sporosarcina sp.]
MRTVEIVTYREEWPVLFQEAATQIFSIFGDELIDIHHMGSTSIKGLAAKPIIDMMPVVKNINDADNYHPQMKSAGYEPLGEFGIPGSRYFRRGGDKRTHHVHIFEQGDLAITRHLAFCDYLRSHPEKADSYGALKLELAARFPFDIESYIEGKEPFIIEEEKKALNWYLRKEEKYR